MKIEQFFAQKIRYVVGFQLLSVMLLTLCSLGTKIFPVIGSLYALAGVRILAAPNHSDFNSIATETASKDFELAYSYGWSSADPDVYERLAQRFILLDNPEVAIFTLARSCCTASTLTQRQEIIKASEQPMHLATLVAKMVELGNESLDEGRADRALKWYRYALERVPDLQPELSFRYAIAAVLAKNIAASQLLTAARQTDKTFEIYHLANSLKINGANFRWMTPIIKDVTYGTPLAYGDTPFAYGTGEDSTGIFWWSGEAIAILQAEYAGGYLLSIRVLHSDPPPVEMVIGIDRQQIQQLTLVRGDNSWETITIPIDLNEGLHSINLWFLNNGMIDGKDRDAAVEWVELRRNT